ncbi:MAG: L-threonylcarbamoyladenylate synthase [Candidatus Krumholzibacteria bacterium]|nr:L-threonylcarbamoyladenylate synthase [Candidatus Krumholzibacteria bacterium]
MRRIEVDDQNTLSLVADALRRQLVVVLPTDTLYGFSTPLSSHGGCELIARLKQSPAERRYLYLASSVDMVAEYVGGWGCTSEDKLRHIWPAPLTAILPTAPHYCKLLGPTIAFRVPRLAMLRRIVQAIGEPIVSTSVNRAGEPPLDDADAIAERFGEHIELLVVGSSIAQASPSTLVDFTRAKPRLIRRGSYAWATEENPSK